MPAIDASLVLSVLGPLFLLLAARQWWRRGRLQPSGRAWLLIGSIFCAVTLWLWQSRGAR